MSLDPFVAGGPFAQLPENRFTVPPESELPSSIEIGGGSTLVQSYTVTRDSKTLSTVKSYTTDTNTWNPGDILQMFGVGSSKSQTTTTITTATGSDISQTVTLSVNLVTGPNDNFTLAIWYDMLFGTLAFQQLQPVGQPIVSGSGVAPGAVVSLQAGGKIHVTVADAQGHYEFRAPNITPGEAQVFVGNNPATTVEVPGGPFRGPIHPLPPLAPILSDPGTRATHEIQ